MSAIVADYMPVRLREKNKGGGRERERQGDILQETPKISEEINWFSCQGLIFKMHRR